MPKKRDAYDEAGAEAVPSERINLDDAAPEARPPDQQRGTSNPSIPLE
jgi:hypothetical protein